jgi:ACR3 family arsenite efflux pump ArsB
MVSPEHLIKATVAVFVKYAPIVFATPPLLLAFINGDAEMIEFWRLLVTMLLTVVGILLGIVFREWNKRLKNVEVYNKNQSQAIELLIALDIALHPERSQEVLKALRDINTLLKAT